MNTVDLERTATGAIMTVHSEAGHPVRQPLTPAECLALAAALRRMAGAR